MLKHPSAIELAHIAGSSATINGKSGKYIITPLLSLPEGFAVNYSVRESLAAKTGVKLDT